MDIVEHCLSLVPVPYLATTFRLFKIICSSIQQVQISKRQLQVLASSLGEHLNTLDSHYCAVRILQADTSQALSNLDG